LFSRLLIKGFVMPVSCFKNAFVLSFSALLFAGAAFYPSMQAQAQEQAAPAQPPSSTAEQPGVLPPALTEAIENLGAPEAAPDPASPASQSEPAQPADQQVDAQGFPVMPAAPQPAAATAVAPPSQEILQEITPPGQAPANVQAVPGTPSDPAAVADLENAEDLFYDANQIAPSPSGTGAQQSSASPRKLDPVKDPASTLIIVTKDSGKHSTDARMVSADRALKLGRYDAALEIYDSLYEKNRKSVGVLMGRAVALQNLGRDDEAVSAYEQVTDIDSGNVDARINMLGIVGQRYPAVALQKLLEIKDENPNNVGVLAQIAVVEAKTGRYDEAMKYLGMAASIEPKNPNHLLNMAVVADRAGKHDMAVKLYEQALEADSIYHGGRVLQRDSVFERLAELR
jgi:tetratricopeptide (TPR) repeat protein